MPVTAQSKPADSPNDGSAPGNMMPPGELLHSIVTKRLSLYTVLSNWNDLDASQRQVYDFAAVEFAVGVDQYQRQREHDNNDQDSGPDTPSMVHITAMLRQHEQGLAEQSARLRELDARMASMGGSSYGFRPSV